MIEMVQVARVVETVVVAVVRMIGFFQMARMLKAVVLAMFKMIGGGGKYINMEPYEIEMGTKNVAFIGSSGGGSATLSSGESIVDMVEAEFKHITTLEDREGVVRITHAVLLVSSIGLDFVNDNSDARLFIREELKTTSQQGNIAALNKKFINQDLILRDLIMTGKIHALVAVSSDPTYINKQSIDAAISMGIPIVGTGGTSISTLSTAGANVICGGGSVATTGTSRGICFAASLASYWNLHYHRPRRSFKLHSVVGGALPFVLVVAVIKSLLPHIVIITTVHADVIAIISKGISSILPTVVTMLVCSESSGLNELGMLTGAAAGSFLNSDDTTPVLFLSIINGLLSAWLLEYLLVLCAKHSFFPTATTIVATGVSALLSGALIGIPLLSTSLTLTHTCIHSMY